MVERYAHQNGAHIQAAMDALEARYTVHPPRLPSAGSSRIFAQLHRNYTESKKGLWLYSYKSFIL